MKQIVILSLMAFLIIQCGSIEEKPTSVGSEGWLSGTTDEKFEVVSEQLGGFGRAMAEVNRRYISMYWAGEDENWDYVDYQLEHLLEAMHEGFVRRPERKNSAQTFLNEVVPQVEEAIESKNKENFDIAFELLTTNCNSCHNKEDMSFIMVSKPENRVENIRLK